MRNKESVTQIFILYGYEKAPKHQMCCLGVR